MDIIHIISILLGFVTALAWGVGFTAALSALFGIRSMKDESARKDRCTERVTFNIIKWEKNHHRVRNKRYIYYKPVYEYKFNCETYQVVGRLWRARQKIKIDHLQINPDNPYEIYEPDILDVPKKLKLMTISFIIALIAYLLTDYISMGQAFKYVRWFTGA